MRETVITEICRQKIIAIIRGADEQQALAAAKALYAGGIALVEVTFNQKAPETFVCTANAIRAIRDAMGDQMLVGAGTVTSVELARMAADSGASYIISPDTDEAVIRETKQLHTRYNKYDMDFYLVDTAGMRKKGKEMEDLEFYSVMRSIRAIENSDVCILMLDAQQGLESQDLNIHNLIVRNRKGCVIVVNKWDLIEKESNTMKEWREFLEKKLAPFSDIPIIFTSVINKQRILEVLQQAIRVYNSRRRRIPTSELNDFILPVIEDYPPASVKGKYIRIKYATQLPTPTPQFAFFVNLPQYIKDSYRRYLENKMREQWDFSGVPIQIYFRQK